MRFHLPTHARHSAHQDRMHQASTFRGKSRGLTRANDCVGTFTPRGTVQLEWTRYPAMVNKIVFYYSPCRSLIRPACTFTFTIGTRDINSCVSLSRAVNAEKHTWIPYLLPVGKVHRFSYHSICCAGYKLANKQFG